MEVKHKFSMYEVVTKKGKGVVVFTGFLTECRRYVDIHDYYATWRILKV